jgi:hypothetical protein
MSQSGIDVSYGVRWTVRSAALRSPPPRDVQVVAAYVLPDSPAAEAGIQRGTQVMMVDGVDVMNGDDVDALYAGLFPAVPDQAHTLVVQDLGATEPRAIELTPKELYVQPVRRVSLGPPYEHVGYLQFNEHVSPAYRDLMREIAALRDEGITDLVLDLRYNGGGFLYVAAELAYMVAGPAASAGRAFYQMQFNDQHPTIDPVTGEPNSPILFGAFDGSDLPHLDLPRVFILTGPGTCSATEALMNGLAGVGIEVIQIGETSCGKPYGFYATDNCGTTYFAIQFSGTNAKGFGDYADGFTPGGHFAGCIVADDVSHELGDPAEARLAAALAYMDSPTCPAARSANPRPAIEDVAGMPQWRQNTILLR